MAGNIHNLIERCIQKDTAAWSEFIDRFSGLLYYSVSSRLKRTGISFNRQDIEDIIQEIFKEIWEKHLLEDVRERDRISGWLSIVAQTRALNYIRTKKERLLRSEELHKLDNIAGSIVNEELIGRLEGLIDEFNHKEKIILKLNIIHGKSHKDIARFMNIPINTVSTIIARKKKLLKGEFF